jgi:hypothetical protein
MVASMIAVPDVRAAEPAFNTGQSASAALADGEWRRDSDLPDRSHVIRAVAAVAVTLAAGTAWLASRRRRGRTASPGWTRFARSGDGTGPGAVVRQSIRLSGAATLHVVAWEGREWLIGCSTAGLTVVAEQSARVGHDTALPVEGQR